MKDRKTGWRFEKSESGGVEGLNHGGVESFKNNHLLSLAKESAQNSLDAQNDKNKPVILEFKKFLIDPSDFPDVENFKKILKLQINFWQKAKNDKSTEEFFKEAITTINSKISCLRVSDFNTTGLEGSKEGKNNWLSRWFKLVRSEGSTDNNPLAGGSFGLGKFANFACSKVRTVFYSTKDLQGTEAHQGVSILASYDTNEEERKRAKGYYCTQEDFSAISGPIYLDKNFKRETPGTDIYIVGFIENEENLEDQLFISILNSFLLAIYKGNLIFKLNDKIVNKDVLSSIINNYRQLKYKDKNLKHIIEYYDILEKNMKSETFHYSMLEENDITLKISTKVELSNAIGMFRNNGMKVFNKKGIRSFNNYSGILLLEGEAVNKYFRKLENPEHDSWEAERSNNYTEAKRRIQKIYLFIKNALTELENKGLLASENMEGIPSLPDEEPEEEGNEPSEGIELEPLKVRVPSKQTRIKRRVKVFGPGGGPIKGPGPISKPGGGKGSSGPGDGKKTTIQVFPNKLKIFHDNQGNYNLIFSLPEEAKDSECRVSISGEEFTEKIEIKEATQIKENKRISLKVYENKISIGNIDKEVTNKIQFKIEDDENWAMEVIFHDNQ